MIHEFVKTLNVTFQLSSEVSSSDSSTFFTSSVCIRVVAFSSQLMDLYKCFAKFTSNTVVFILGTTIILDKSTKLAQLVSAAHMTRQQARFANKMIYLPTTK